MGSAARKKVRPIKAEMGNFFLETTRSSGTWRGRRAASGSAESIM